MLAGKLGGQRIVDPGAAAGRIAVDRNRNAYPRSANGDSAVRAAGGNDARQLCALNRIIDAFGSVGSQVAHFVAQLGKPVGELVLEEISGMIGGKSDTHGLQLGLRRRIRQCQGKEKAPSFRLRNRPTGSSLPITKLWNEVVADIVVDPCYIF